MDKTRFERLQDLVAEALERDLAGRGAFLRAACGGDAELLAEAESLLGHEQAGDALLENSPLARFVHDDASPEAAASELRPGDTLGEYRVLSLLGEGGMGEVYLAEDTKLERRVALKLLKRRLGDEALGRRFTHERRVLASLTHPGIARLYGGDTTPTGRSYLVMEHVEGERLDVYCDTRRLKLDDRLQLFRKICAAVSYAHQNLVVHRDLKPANIRVTHEGEPKLLDFGIAKLLDPEGTQGADPTVTMFAAMTPEYASPEQVRGEATTTATDVYSLGVILYELLTGQRPYRLKSRRADELARAICEDVAPRPSTVAATTVTTDGGLTVGGETPAQLQRLLRGDLDNIVAKALAKEPTRRYASVAQFSEDIRRHCEGLTVSARRDTLRYRAGKFVRRNKILVGAIALVTLALLTGLVAATWQAHVARQERDRAQLAQAKAETALKQAKRINSFLQNLFASPGAAKLGKDAKVLQVLDAASQNLDRDLADEPEVLAQAHLTLSWMYGSLQTDLPAGEHAQAALDLLRRLHGEDHPTTVEAMIAFSESLVRRGFFDRAEPLLREALARMNRLPTPDARLKFSSLIMLSFTLAELNRQREAEVTWAEAQTFTLRTYGENSREYIRLWNILGTQKRQAKDEVGAVVAFRQALELCEKVRPDGILTSTIRLNLATALFALQRLDEFHEAIRRLEQDSQQLVGENSRLYFATVTMSAIGDFNDGNFPSAEAKGRKILGTVEATLPPGYITTVQMQAILGLSLTRTGRAGEGEPLLRRAHGNGANIPKVEFINTYGNLDSALGECLLTQDYYAEAEGLLLAGYEELKTRLGESHLQSVRVRGLLRELYSKWGKPDRAGLFAEQALVPSQSETD